MVRTQIQLYENQADALKKMASEAHVSMAELIRRSVAAYLEGVPKRLGREEQKDRAIRAAGRFRSGVSDLATNHDGYLEEVFGR